MGRAAALAAAIAIAGCGGSPASYTLAGAITAMWTPLAGARVRVQGASDVDGPRFVATAADGSYALPIEKGHANAPIVVTAGAVGWKSAAIVGLLPAGGRAPTLDLRPIPVDDPGYRFQTVDFGDPPCNFCHFDQVDRWSRSQHAQAEKDPLVLDEYRAFVAWWQKLDPYATDEATAFAGPFLPTGAKGDIGATFDDGGGARYRVVSDGLSLGDCAKCHVPTYALAGGQDFRPSAIATLADAAVYAEGVTCDFCHKVRSVETDGEAVLTKIGIEKVALARPGAGDQIMFGPFDDVTYSEMQSSYLPLIATSEFCADCHSDAKTLVLQPVDAAGADSGAVVNRLVWGEDTYREWRFAPPTVHGVHPPGSMSASGDGPFTGANNYAGRALGCQECHMQDPPPDPMTGESIAGYQDPKDNDSRIATNAEAVERDPRTLHPHEFKGRTARFVAWATELSASARRDGGQIAVDVAVENRHTGHRFPSGLPDRNALLVVTATDGTGAPLALASGPTLPGWASGDGKTDPARDLAGQPGRGFARVLGASSGEAPVFYLRAVRDAAPDTRLAPGDVDRSSYRFAAGSGAVTVTARIVHRLRFKAQSDRFLAGHPGADPASFETAGDSVTIAVP